MTQEEKRLRQQERRLKVRELQELAKGTGRCAIPGPSSVC